MAGPSIWPQSMEPSRRMACVASGSTATSSPSRSCSREIMCALATRAKATPSVRTRIRRSCARKTRRRSERRDEIRTSRCAPRPPGSASARRRPGRRAPARRAGDPGCHSCMGTQGCFHHADQELAVEGLDHEGHRAGADGADARVIVAVPGEDDGRNGVTGADQSLLQAQAVEARHTEVEDQARGGTCLAGGQKGFRRWEADHGQTHGPEEALERLTYGCVVVDDRDHVGVVHDGPDGTGARHRIPSIRWYRLAHRYIGGPRNGPPNPPTFGAPRPSRVAPLTPPTFGAPRPSRVPPLTPPTFGAPRPTRVPPLTHT